MKVTVPSEEREVAPNKGKNSTGTVFKEIVDSLLSLAGRS